MRSFFKLISVLSLFIPAGAFAANIAVTGTNLSSSISSTSVFQSIQAKQTVRQGCTVQNPAVNTNHQWVYFGPIANATTANSVELIPGQSVNCTVGSGGGSLQDQVSITGTSGDTFYANFQ